MNSPQKISVWLDSLPDEKRFFALDKEIEADAVVVGAGIVGILTAWHLTKRGLRVVVLEKNHVATGDTGLTTGFLTRVPDTSLAELQKTHGPDFIKELVTATSRAQQELFSLIKDEQLECEFAKCSSYFGAYEPGDAALKDEAIALTAADPNTERVSQDKTSAPFSEAVRIQHEGVFHVRKFLFALLARPSAQTIRIFEESEATNIESTQEGITAHTSAGSVRAKMCIVAVGNPSTLLPELSSLLTPKLTYVVGARFDNAPLSDSLFWDTQDPYFYFRKIDSHTIIVGGCDKIAREQTTQNQHEKIEQFITQHLPGTHKITHQWSGSLFDTKDGIPYACAHPHRANVYVATGFGGNGLVFGALAARTIAQLTQEETPPAAPLLSFERTQATIEQPASYTPPAPTKKTFIAVGTTEEFKENTPRCVMAGNTKLIVIAQSGTYYALENACSHAGGPLCEGTLENNVIQCPWHAARFDITTGEVLGPPAVTAQKTFPVRVSGNTVEVEVPTESASSSSSPKPAPQKIARDTHWGSVLKFSLFATAFWLLEFAAQYFWLTKGEIAGSLVRSFALAGATLIGAALASSALFKWRPRMAQYWRTRRYLGVAGFTLTLFHALAVTHFYFDYEISALFYTLNPLENPIIFGAIAFPILLVLAITSTDWMVQKLTPKVWKFVHRFVYIAYGAAVLHFLFINPALLNNPVGYLLLFVTAFAIFGELYWFIKTTAKKKFRSLGTLIGAVIIIAVSFTGYLAYKKAFPPPKPAPATQEQPLEEAIKDMVAFMENNAPDSDVATEPIAEDRAFAAELVASGTFQNVNYMTSGGASIQKQGDTYSLVFDETFETPNGPDLQIYLTKNSSPTTRTDIREGRLLGKLKSITGKQVYALPSALDIDAYHSVSIHCKAFNVPWSFAPLE